MKPPTFFKILRFFYNFNFVNVHLIQSSCGNFVYLAFSLDLSSLYYPQNYFLPVQIFAVHCSAYRRVFLNVYDIVILQK